MSGVEIAQNEIGDAAVLFARMQSATPFSARDFAEWMRIGGEPIEEEPANEILLAEVAVGRLRELGPGVYALAITGPAEVPLQHPLWPEDAAV